MPTMEQRFEEEFRQAQDWYDRLKERARLFGYGMRGYKFGWFYEEEEGDATD